MTASTRSYYGPLVLADEVRLARWQFERAEAAGLLPKPGHARGWLPDQLDEVRQLVPAIVERFGAEHPVGAGRCADRLGERLGVDVEPADIAALAEAGHLAVVDVFEKKGRAYDLYAPADVDALTKDQVMPIIDARLAWVASSVAFDEAVGLLGWRREELEKVVAERGLHRGQFRRFARADIDALAADTELGEQIAAGRPLAAQTAAVLFAPATSPRTWMCCSICAHSPSVCHCRHQA